MLTQSKVDPNQSIQLRCDRIQLLGNPTETTSFSARSLVLNPSSKFKMHPYRYTDLCKNLPQQIVLQSCLCCQL